MTATSKVVVVMPAYNAARTLERVYHDIAREEVDEIVVVDDCSQDATVEVARRLPVTLIVREKNGGYGANQKTCYDYARSVGADYVVMLHADYQYDARVLPAVLLLLRLGICDVILGNRIRTRKEALACGMPAAKYFSNRGLTVIENLLSGQNLGEWHSGFRAYSRAVLDTIPYQRNSDNFVFDSQFLVQSVHFGFKIGDIPVPVRYFDEASSISLSSSARYAMATLGTFAQWYGHRFGLATNPLFEAARITASATQASSTPSSSTPSSSTTGERSA
jgi:glycosyltransferase involved in cell wall biosynthesis